jgi:hypothetical protein
MIQGEILRQMIDSDVNRPIELMFLEDTHDFFASVPYSATLRYVDENVFYIVIPSVSDQTEPPDDNILKGKYITLPPLDTHFEVASSFYQPDLGYLLILNNSGIELRKFLRIPFNETVYVSILNDDESQTEYIECQALNLSGSGISIRCNLESPFAHGMNCNIKIVNSDFPGYDKTQDAAILYGQIVRVFSDITLSDWKDFGIEFEFKNPSDELIQTNLIDRFCWKVAFPESRGNKNVQEVLKLITDLSSSFDLNTLLLKAKVSAAKLVSSEESSVLLFDEDKRSLHFTTASGDKAPILKNIPLTEDNGGIAWWVAQTGEPAIVNDVASDPRRPASVDGITGFVTRSLLAVPIIWNAEVLGVLEAVNKRTGTKFTHLDLQLFILLSNQIASVIKNAQTVGKYENFFNNSIELLVKSIESVGTLIGVMSPGHCWEVASPATFIGQQFGMSEEEINDLYYGAVLHDIGFLELQTHNTFQLDYVDEENDDTKTDIIQAHPTTGANMIREIRLLKGAVPIIRHHHERFDGTGYPDGLAGENIPLGARIVAVIEAYHEMLYGKEHDATAKKRALEKIKDVAGIWFDPQVVELFVNQVA